MFWQQLGLKGSHHEHDHHRHHAEGRGGRRSGPGRGRGQRPGGDEATGNWFSGEPPRADRGGVRYLVLDAIVEQARHGYEIIQVISEKSRDTYKPSPGVVYPTLQMLEDLGHAQHVEADGRKSFTITAAGKQDLAEHQDYVQDFYERVSDNPWDRFAADFGEIKGRIHLLMKTFKRALRRGQLSSPALAEVIKVLDEAVAKIQQIFAEERGGE